jgi:hypothetical protein
MQTLFGDVLDLYLFRVKSLAAYRYPWWQVALFLTALGVVASGSSPELGRFLPGRIGFCILYSWLESLLFAVYLGVWLRMGRFRMNRSLLSLVMLSSGIQLLQPLVSWLPEDVGNIALVLLMLYSFLVLCHALVTVSGMRRVRVLCGVLLFSLLSGILLQSTWYLTSRFGWVDAPPSWWNPLDDTGSAGDAASPSSRSSSGSSDSDSSSDDDALI